MESFYFFEGEALKTTTQADSPPDSGCEALLFSNYNEGSVPDLSDLDPSVEFSVDIQQLIEQSQQQVTGHSHHLFPELLPNHDQSSSDSPLENNANKTSADDDQPMPDVFHVVVPQDDAVCPNVKEEPESPFVHTIQGTVFQLPEHLVESSVDLSTIELGSFGVPSQQAATPEAESTSSKAYTSTASPGRSSLKATPPSRSSRKRNLDKNSNEYRERRDKNNVAVRKSRDKAKFHQKETEGKVETLMDENDRLQKKVDLLTKELTVLKGLFANVGVVIPPEVQKYLK